MCTHTHIYIYNTQYLCVLYTVSFPGDSIGKESTCSARDLGLTPGLRRSLGEGNGNPLQYSCLGNPMDSQAWWTTVHGVSRTAHDLATKPPPYIYIYICKYIYFTPSYQRKIMNNLDRILKSRHYFANKGPFCQGYGFSSSHIWM